MNRSPSAHRYRLTVLGVSALFGLLVLVFVRTGLGTSDDPDDEVLSILVDTHDRIWLGGRFGDSKIQRRMATGRRDREFESTWQVAGFNRPVHGLVEQPDGQVIVVGEFTNFDQSLVGGIARLRPDGRLDTSFANANGTGFDDTAKRVALSPDGKIIVAGSFGSFNGFSARGLARLHPDGTFDASFEAASALDGEVTALKIDSVLRRIWVAGSFQHFGPTPVSGLIPISLDDGTLALGTH